MNLLSGEGLTWRETPYGRVAIVASHPGFEVALIYKEQEPVDPSPHNLHRHLRVPGRVT